MKKKIAIIAGLVVLVGLAIFLFGNTDRKAYNSPLVAKVQQGDFDIRVKTTGELQAKKSVQIRGPEGIRNRSLGIREVKILDLVPEGTVVDSGDYVARLDKTEALSTLQDIEDELEKRKSEYITTKLDTAMELKKLRNQLIDLEYTVEEQKIKVKQSKYEPPATQRQARIELDRAERELSQARENYELQVEQAKAQMNEVSINLAKQRRKKEEMEELLQKFTIHAPQPGMVIYKKGWDGKKRKEGSTISPWDLTVATLPDLSTMISKTFVNEIDISKVDEGQKTDIQVDAFPDRKYTGSVTEVANIGQELRNTGAKVFEVIITLNQTDSILRPSMTSSNEIITGSFSNVKYLPLEAVHSNDKFSYVYTTNPGKKEVELGKSNENYIIVKQGLNAGQEVYLNVPENADEMELVPLKD